MPHLYPIVVPGGRSIAGLSLGFHAYSLRIDNLSNQWLQEESSLAWIPPYSLGTSLRLYGTAVALLYNQAPTGQPQPAPITGEYAMGFYSDELRTEVPGVPVRQFTLIQAVSDLTQGPEPAFPPVGVDRLWADSSGLIHHLHSNGVDTTLTDPLQTGVVTSAMILDGTIASADMAAGAAAANVGALGGVLTGTLPSPGMAAGAAASNVGALSGALSGNLPAPTMVYASAAGSRINGVVAGANQLIISVPIPTPVAGVWLVWAHIMAMNRGAANDNYQFGLYNQSGSALMGLYQTFVPNLWGSLAWHHFLDNSGGTNTQVNLRLNGSSTVADVAGDFGRVSLLRLY